MGDANKLTEKMKAELKCEKSAFQEKARLQFDLQQAISEGEEAERQG